MGVAMETPPFGVHGLVVTWCEYFSSEINQLEEGHGEGGRGGERREGDRGEG